MKNRFLLLEEDNKIKKIKRDIIKPNFPDADEFKIKDLFEKFRHATGFMGVRDVFFMPEFARILFNELDFGEENVDNTRQVNFMAVLAEMCNKIPNFYNSNIVGKSFNEIYQNCYRTAKAYIKEKKQKQKQNSGQNQTINNNSFNSNYNIIDDVDYEDANKIGNYTGEYGESKLCYTQDEFTWRNYTDNGRNTCYCLLRNDWQNVPCEHTEQILLNDDGSPVYKDADAYDSYGLSIIFVFINPEGEIAYSNTRWNHKARTVDYDVDQAFDDSDLERILNCSFSSVFKNMSNSDENYNNLNYYSIKAINRQIANGTNLNKLFYEVSIVDGVKDCYIVSTQNFERNIVYRNKLCFNRFYKEIFPVLNDYTEGKFGNIENMFCVSINDENENYYDLNTGWTFDSFKYTIATNMPRYIIVRESEFADGNVYDLQEKKYILPKNYRIISTTMRYGYINVMNREGYTFLYDLNGNLIFNEPYDDINVKQTKNSKRKYFICKTENPLNGYVSTFKIYDENLNQIKTFSAYESGNIELLSNGYMFYNNAIYDKNGNEIIVRIASQADYNKRGLCVVILTDNSANIIDENGNFLLNEKCRYINDLLDNEHYIIKPFRRNGEYIIDSNFKRCSEIYSEICFNENIGELCVAYDNNEKATLLLKNGTQIFNSWFYYVSLINHRSDFIAVIDLKDDGEDYFLGKDYNIYDFDGNVVMRPNLDILSEAIINFNKFLDRMNYKGSKIIL